MRLATLILGLLFGLLLVLWSFIGYAVDHDAMVVTGDADWAAGVFWALLFLWALGVALVMAWPWIAMLAFDTAMILSGITLYRISNDTASTYTTAMALYVFLSFLLGVFSALGWRGKRKADRAAREQQSRIDQMLSQIDSSTARN